MLVTSWVWLVARPLPQLLALFWRAPAAALLSHLCGLNWLKLQAMERVCLGKQGGSKGVRHSTRCGSTRPVSCLPPISCSWFQSQSKEKKALRSAHHLSCCWC